MRCLGPERFSDDILSAAWIFIAVEIAVAIPSLMHNSWTMMSMKKRYRPKLRLRGYDVPTYRDVFVTCCGEDDDLVMDTVRGACDVDYPYDKFRVIVLDDGKSETLEAAVSPAGHVLPQRLLHGSCENSRTAHHFKAGNLNYGLEQTHLLPGGAGQFMAAFPSVTGSELFSRTSSLMTRWLLHALPSCSTTRPPSDPLSQSLDFFVHVIEPIKDALGVAWCTGSGYVVRREALDEIGNFPLGSLAEDVATSTLMLGKGWKTAFIHEPLQFGTVPEDFGSHLKQRTRWAIGTVDTAFKLKFCLWGEKIRQMTFAQRFSGFLYAMLSLYTILVSISLFAIPIILVMGKPLGRLPTEEQLRWLIRACFATTISNRLCEFVLFIPAGYHTGQRGSRYQPLDVALHCPVPHSFLHAAQWLGGQVQAFKPTGSLSSALNERDPALKKNMFRRVWTILINYMGIFHLVFVYFTLVGVVLTSYRCFVRTDSTHCPEREQLLDRDPKTMVAHPTPKSKKIAFGGQAAWFEFELTMSTLYTTLIFVVSFIF
ncbi:hypothetical protein J3459_014050 [Metarhizium acridum]|nr:hypothetical protein J3459_014050 [Metarhizium acridum]